MLKALGAILVISSSAGIGMYFSHIIKERLEDLKELKKYILVLRGEIKYGGTPLPEAISHLGIRSKNHFQGFFEKVGLELSQLNGNTFQKIWEEAVEKDLMDTCLTKKDKIDLARFGDTMGVYDKETQINTMDLFIHGLEQEIEEASPVVKEKTRLYNLLGIMGGIFITIVMM